MNALVEVGITTRELKLPQADFAFSINYQKGKGPASRIFSATHDFIIACENIDKALLASIDSSIVPVMAVEDIEASSLKVWFRVILHSIDDQALKNMDWKPAIGNFLVKGKYALLKRLSEEEEPLDLPVLTEEIKQLAEETDVRHFDDYPPVSARQLIGAIKDFDKVKDHLSDEDEAYMEVVGEDPVSIDQTVRISVERLEELAARRTEVTTSESMILTVRKPDYLGETMWEFRHYKRAISAKIEALDWLQRFQAKEEDVRPGDALDCQVRIETTYDYADDVLMEKHFVTGVNKVLPNDIVFRDLPLESNGGEKPG